MTQAVHNIKEAYEYLLANWTDMQDHVPMLRHYAKGNCMEIGVRGGASTAALLMGIEEKGGHLWSFDIHDCPVFEGHSNWTFTQADTQKEQERILEIVSDELEVLFVDGDHSKEGCLSDLQTFGPRAKLILIHDCLCPDTFPGVRQAAEEYAASIGKTLEIHEGSYGLGIIRK